MHIDRFGKNDHILFVTAAGDIANKEVVTLRNTATIQEAAQEMSRNRINSLIIVNDEDLPVGIVTDHDLRLKAVARGRTPSTLIQDIMSLPLVRIDAQESCFDAVLKMIKHEVHHLLIIREGRLQGVLTSDDLMMLQSAAPLSFAREVERQESIKGLAPLSSRINSVVGQLLQEGVRASNITKVVTELNDLLARKVHLIAEKEFGRPPVPFCWIAFGSEGRKEQTFKTDQDNAVIYADPRTPGEEQQAERYFPQFAIFVREGLARCGFPLCPADYMATNPAWRKSLSQWKGSVAQWAASDSAEAVTKALMMFDFRFMYGDITLAERFHDYLMQSVKNVNGFLDKIASAACKSRPALGFFKTFLLERNGGHKNQLNLMNRGLGPIIDIIRVLAIEAGITETSTLERTQALKGRHPTIDIIGNELSQAFEFMLMILIHHQDQQVKQGRTRDHFINPGSLSKLEKRMLRESFHIITQAQAALSNLAIA